MKKTASGRVGLFQGFVLVSLPVALCALAAGWSAWPLYAIWVALGGARIRYGDRKALQDTLLFGGVISLLLRQSIIDALFKRRSASIKDTESLATATTVTIVALTACWYIKGMVIESHPEEVEQLPTGSRTWSLEHPQSFVIPCRTTHARIFPKKHSFGYNYLLCGFPIVPAVTTPEGIDLPDGSDQSMGKWWLRINAADYLMRGQACLGFYGKLKVFLREKVISDHNCNKLVTESVNRGSRTRNGPTPIL